MFTYKTIIYLIVYHNFNVNCWLFNSVYTSNNKLIDILDVDNGAYPIPYEKKDDNSIDDDNPPDPPRERIILTFPGTKWCGPGNIATDYHDLGNWTETDKCCRDHDFCDDIIPAGHTAHGLVNNDFYTKLSCSCDDKFFNCLHASTDSLAVIVGKVYFNGIGTQCFKNEYPIIKCKKTRGFLVKKCMEYELDMTKPKLYQWFDVPSYNKK